MRKQFLFKFFCACCSLAIAHTALADKLYVKIVDLSESGASKYSGVDIEAIELLNDRGNSAYFADAVLEYALPPNEANSQMKAEDILGQTVLTHWGSPYVFSMNGGHVVAVIDTGLEAIAQDWLLTIYEVDGSLYDWGDAPEPFRVAIADSPKGPWRSLGMGSGTSRFTLDGQKKPALDDETFKKIIAALEEKPKNDPVPPELLEKMQPMLNRLKSLDDIQQLRIELAALYTFFNYRDHVVNEHKEADNGRVMAPWELLDSVYKRYQQLTDGKTKY